MMTHPITWGPPLCRLQTNPDQLNPLMYCALLDSWGKHVDQLKLLILLRPRTDFGFCKLVTFFSLQV